MKHIKLCLILLAACTEKQCEPSVTIDDWFNELDYLHKQCINAGFTPKKCTEIENKKTREMLKRATEHPCKDSK